jgi:predicted permease
MKILQRLWYLLRQHQQERELAEEIEFHRQMSGDPRAMGNITRAREEARAVWICPWLQSVWQDAAYAIRNLRRQPGFALLALAALGFAIGINTSLFTVYNAVAIRPWPVKDPERVVTIFSTDRRYRVEPRSGISVAEYRYFLSHSRAFAGVAVTRQEPVHFGFESFGEPSWAAFVSGNYFQVLGVGMQLGRGFLPEEDLVQAPEAVAVLGFPYWRDHFGSNPEIVGKQVRVDEIPFTVVGVAPENFTGASGGGSRQDLYLPYAALPLLHPTESWPRDLLTNPNACCDFALGRLAPGVSRAQGATELEVLDRQFQAERGLQGHGFVLAGSATLDTVGRPRQITAAFILMFTGGMLVVLLACANVGNLLIARATARQKEIEIRRAIGAGRARIIRQLMTESLLLALAATALGVLIAYKLPLFILAQVGEIPPFRMTPDGTVLGYAIALAVLACVAFGLAPALHGTRPATASRLALRNLLLAAQVGLSVVLLIGAGLMLRGVADLRRRDPGFAIEGVSIVSFELPARSTDGPHNQAFYRQMILAARGARIGMTESTPLGNGFRQTDLRPSDAPETQRITMDYEEVTAGYFEVLRIPIVAGRNFEPGDQGRNVALVNETLARRFWPGQDPIGKKIVSPRTTREIVGVVRDARTGNLDNLEAILYVPFTGFAIPKILVDSNDTTTVEAVRAAVVQLEPRARMEVQPLRDNLGRQLRSPRLGAQLAGALGLFALILATVGMAGVFAYAVHQRTREIGIRIALGARPKQVVRLVLGGSSRAVVIGLAAGLAIALPASRLLRSELYGVSPLDPVAYLSVAVILAIAGLAASYAPARRATRVDPVTALRHE